MTRASPGSKPVHGERREVSVLVGIRAARGMSVPCHVTRWSLSDGSSYSLRWPRPRRIYPVRVRPRRRLVRVAARSSRAGAVELTPRREVSGFLHRAADRAPCAADPRGAAAWHPAGSPSSLARRNTVSAASLRRCETLSSARPHTPEIGLAIAPLSAAHGRGVAATVDLGRSQQVSRGRRC